MRKSRRRAGRKVRRRSPANTLSGARARMADSHTSRSMLALATSDFSPAATTQLLLAKRGVRERCSPRGRRRNVFHEHPSPFLRFTPRFAAVHRGFCPARARYGDGWGRFCVVGRRDGSSCGKSRRAGRKSDFGWKKSDRGWRRIDFVWRKSRFGSGQNDFGSRQSHFVSRKNGKISTRGCGSMHFANEVFNGVKKCHVRHT